MRINRSSEAVLDIIETAAYIAGDNLDAAIRFIDAVDESLYLIAQSPDIGVLRKVGNAPEMRMWIVREFPNALLFYRATTTEVNLIRVIHSSRDFYRVFDSD